MTALPSPALDKSGSEASLEPEFIQLRSRLSALPEFSGADAESKHRLAEELARRGDVQGAVDSYRGTIAMRPDWADPYCGLGQVLLDHHDYGEAVQALETGIRLGRADQQSYYWLGRAFMGKGELPEAAAALQQAVRLGADDAEAMADLGLVYMAQGDVSGAADAFARSIKLKPDYTDAHRLRDQLLEAKGDRSATKEAGLRILRALFERE
jgi:tetratricopeptide (TPR) repeat protein